MNKVECVNCGKVFDSLADEAAYYDGQDWFCGDCNEKEYNKL